VCNKRRKEVNRSQEKGRSYRSARPQWRRRSHRAGSKCVKVHQKGAKRGAVAIGISGGGGGDTDTGAGSTRVTVNENRSQEGGKS